MGTKFRRFLMGGRYKSAKVLGEDQAFTLVLSERISVLFIVLLWSWKF